MSIINAQAFKIIEGRPVTSSRIVAEYFGKRHNDVLRGIRDLIEKNTDLSKSFIAREEQVETGNGASRSNPVFLMDQKGFCILAMGFTGAKALEFKCAFYDEFERMKHELEAPTTITPAEQRAIQREVAIRAHKTASNYRTIYRAIKARYQIARYDQLPRTQLEDCLDFIREVELDVPEVPHTTRPDDGGCPHCGLHLIPAGSIVLSAHEAENLRTFVYYWRYLFREDLETVLKLMRLLQSPLAARFYEAVTSMNLGSIEDMLERNGYSVRQLSCYRALTAK
uniref:Regulatory protein n=1 Tax=Podoviridae sp. ctiwu7 TaxID=2825269 RepID=A0A8S5QBV4_9CAUD|nr:MAG TPA: regulatory protein [Podoviridae sp. ctiwu7]